MFPWYDVMGGDSRQAAKYAENPCSETERPFWIFDEPLRNLEECCGNTGKASSGSRKGFLISNQRAEQLRIMLFDD